jgi:hydrogenase maturation protein HypF
MLRRGLNSPLCSSVGRLFDAVASLVGLKHRMRFEGQAAMELEFALHGMRTDEAYDLPLITSHSPMILDWSRLVEGILLDVNRGIAASVISAKFHNGLAETIVAVAREFGCERVALSGGCFQNRYLVERAVTRLRVEGFQPYWHQRVPTNDGGIALGQVVVARRELARCRAPFTPLQQLHEPLSIRNDSPPIMLKRTEAPALSATSRAEPVSRVTHHVSH